MTDVKVPISFFVERGYHLRGIWRCELEPLIVIKSHVFGNFASNCYLNEADIFQADLEGQFIKGEIGEKTSVGFDDFAVYSYDIENQGTFWEYGSRCLLSVCTLMLKKNYTSVPENKSGAI